MTAPSKKHFGTTWLKFDFYKRIKSEFEILPKDWIAERTFPWRDNFPHLDKDFEHKIFHVQSPYYSM